MSESTLACNIVIFGAKGDLSRRKLMPSLYQLEKHGYLSKNTQILGVGRATWSKKEYDQITKDAMMSFMSDEVDESIWQSFSQKLNFHQLDVYDTQSFHDLQKALNPELPCVFYFAMHPSTFGVICEGLSAANLNQKPNRIVMEKPIGTDLASSKEINNAVSTYFNESQVYRIDHYLGKDTILNLFTLRFANPLFSSIWSRDFISHVQITVAEQVGIEGRWSYFDKAGQMRDMVQNHLLQILSIIAMATPENLDDNTIRQEKIKLLKSLTPITAQNINEKAVRGQYIEGTINQKSVPSYLDEEGANFESNTETFVALNIDINNDQWRGVPFYLRTGKRLKQKCTEVVIYFKNEANAIFANSLKIQNKLTIRLQPNEGIDLEILNNVPGISNDNKFKTTQLNFDYSSTFNENMGDAYERLFLEVIKGKQALFVHRDEVEAAWAWIDSIINAWQQKNDVVKYYNAGTFGPKESDDLLSSNGHAWNNH